LIVGLEEAKSKRKLTFPLFSDSTLATSGALGLAFHLDDEEAKLYLEKYKIDLEKISGQKHHNLPVPAVYIIDAGGTIRFTYINPDYKIRLLNDELMKEAKAIAK